MNLRWQLWRTKSILQQKSRSVQYRGTFCGVHITTGCYRGAVLPKDRPTRIFHTFPVMPTLSCAEQQFLKWVVMFKYKLAIPSVEYLIFFFFPVNLLTLQSKIHVSQGHVFVLIKCGLSALLNVNLSFTAKQVTT